MNAVKDAYEVYQSLLAEKKHCLQVRREAAQAEVRLRQLEDSYGGSGEITEARERYETLRLPIYDSDARRIRRIYAVDDKWITLKTEGCGEPPLLYRI